MHREGNGHRPENRQRAPTRGTALFRYPSGIVGGFSAAWFMAKPLTEVTTSWVVHVGCRYSFWSLFSRDSCGFSGEKVVSGVRIDKTSVSEVEKSGVRILVWNGERTESVLPRVSVSEAEDLGVRILE